MMELMNAELAKQVEFESEVRTASARIAGFEASRLALAEDTSPVGDFARRKLDEKIRKEQGTLSEAKGAVEDCKGKISAFEEVLKLLPKDGEEAPTDDLRSGSELAAVQNVLRQAGHALALGEILEALGKAGDDKKRNALRGSLSNYARQGRVFTKEEAPDTFGLIEFLAGPPA
jgi:hypothetical protein